MLSEKREAQRALTRESILRRDAKLIKDKLKVTWSVAAQLQNGPGEAASLVHTTVHVTSSAVEESETTV